MSREAVVEAVEEATDVVFDTIEAVPEVVKNNPFVLAAVALTSLAIGAGVSIFVTRKILQTKYEALLYEEIQETKAFYSKQFKTGKFADPTTLAEDIDDEELPDDEFNPETAMVKEAIDILQDQKYVAYDKADKASDSTVVVADVDMTVTRNVFVVNDDEEFDLDVELAKKSSGKPYVIEVEQFLENDAENTQVTLTWYEGDGVLVDEREQAIRSYGGVIGEENLKFGYGSKDSNIVYIRNDRFDADYEVIKSELKYAEVVLGFKEPKANGGKTRKFPKDGD